MIRLLQPFRRIFGGIFFILLLLYLSGVGSALGKAGAVLSKWQLVPALLGGTLVPMVVILLITLVAGRWYCSTLCPMGILQDGIARLPGKKGRGNGISRKNPRMIRYVVLLLCVVIFFSGTTVFLLLADPWSAFGRITTSFAQPPVTLGNNLLALLFNYYGNYLFVARGYYLAGLSVIMTAFITVVLLFFLPRFFGPRSWCLAICPVGTVLGWLARVAPLRIRIDEVACVSCMKCEKVCKTGVIDIENGKLDAGDCIACCNCLPACPHNAISYGLKRGTGGGERQ